jgi:hypothetical protein
VYHHIQLPNQAKVITMDVHFVINHLDGTHTGNHTNVYIQGKNLLNVRFVENRLQDQMVYNVINVLTSQQNIFLELRKMALIRNRRRLHANILRVMAAWNDQNYSIVINAIEAS